MRARRMMVCAALALLAALMATASAAGLIELFGFGYVNVDSAAMSPTLEIGDRVLVARVERLEPGDVIAYRWKDSLLIKRVIAFAGEWVNIDADGAVYVNDVLLDEPYVESPCLGPQAIAFPHHVAEDSVFVLGDNRGNSRDSRNEEHGDIPMESVVGKVMLDKE